MGVMVGFPPIRHRVRYLVNTFTTRFVAQFAPETTVLCGGDWRHLLSEGSGLELGAGVAWQFGPGHGIAACNVRARACWREHDAGGHTRVHVRHLRGHSLPRLLPGPVPEVCLCHAGHDAARQHRGGRALQPRLDACALRGARVLGPHFRLLLALARGGSVSGGQRCAPPHPRAQGGVRRPPVHHGLCVHVQIPEGAHSHHESGSGSEQGLRAPNHQAEGSCGPHPMGGGAVGLPGVRVAR
mmetsp:Transcript_39887/g.74846  ORF Transcript_39887/g.74846 Transcript_39887/m.74846 type:complete len:241 (-) Transcript_39887:1919-2641(-)